MTGSRATVLLATRNRASTLDRVLRAYGRLRPPPGGWEVVVVDNGSTDQTRNVVEAARERIPVTYCFEPRPGKNRALNTGLALATGGLVVFTDDDILPRPDWLVELCAAADLRESASIIAGVITPCWESAPPDWILRGVPTSVCFGFHPTGFQEGPEKPSIAFGGNLAIRADVFRRGYRFNPAIGPLPTRYTMGGEAELIRRLVREGHEVWGCPRAVVEHLIPTSHMTPGWILERAVRWGRSQQFFGSESAEPMALWWKLPRWIFRGAVRQAAAAAHAWLVGDRAGLLRARWELHCLYGIAVEARSAERGVEQGGPPLGVATPEPRVEAGGR
jgi:glycosyltransferase involved in cell wall biosynthesis